MIKSELIYRLDAKMRMLSEADVENAVNGILTQITDNLSMGKRIEIRGFGSFSVRHRAPRRAHNPRTGEQVLTHSKYRPYFRAGKAFRERVNEAYLRALSN